MHDAHVAAVVTTSDFTAPAVEYAERCGILCFDRTALRAWSDGTGPAPWSTIARTLAPTPAPIPTSTTTFRPYDASGALGG